MEPAVTCTLLNTPHLDVLDDGSESRAALGPGPHQLHRVVKVSDVVGIHPQEGRVLQEDLTQAWALTPEEQARRQINWINLI